MHNERYHDKRPKPIRIGSRVLWDSHSRHLALRSSSSTTWILLLSRSQVGPSRLAPVSRRPLGRLARQSPRGSSGVLFAPPSLFCGSGDAIGVEDQLALCVGVEDSRSSLPLTEGFSVIFRSVLPRTSHVVLVLLILPCLYLYRESCMLVVCALLACRLMPQLDLALVRDQ